MDGQKVAPHYFLKEGDEIERTLKSATQEEKKAGLSTKRFSLRIIAETPAYIVVDKPAGLAVHRSGNIQGETLADLLLERYPELEGVGEDPARPGIVHRLDKDVSGLMVVARDQEAFKKLKKQFQGRSVGKVYLALVYGHLDKESGTINFPIERSSSGRRMAALPLTRKGEANPEGREAITEFKVLKNFINYAFLEVRIKTGRTHQIRVHLAAYDHPIVGDDLYGTNKTKLKNKKFNLGRVFLVSSRLTFKDAEGKRQTFEIDLPERLKEILKEVK